jgi:hypothetical protein
MNPKHRTDANYHDDDHDYCPAKKKIKVLGSTLTERMSHVACHTMVPTVNDNPKIFFIHTGWDKYNMDTMTRQCYEEHDCNVWPILRKRVKVGDIIMSTSYGEGYTTLHTVIDKNLMERKTYRTMYNPMDDHDHPRFLLTLGLRQEINVPRNSTHSKLKFDECIHLHQQQGPYKDKLNIKSIVWICLNSRRN